MWHSYLLQMEPSA